MSQQTSNTQAKRLIDSAEANTLAAILDAEINNAPLAWQRYRADNPRRITVLDRLLNRRMIDLVDNRIAITLTGFVSLQTRAARRLRAVLESAFTVMREHYRSQLGDPLPFAAVAKRARVDLDDLVVAARILQRGGPTLMSAGQPPVTQHSSFSGVEELLRRKSFRSFVDELRRELAQPYNPFGAFGRPAFPDAHSAVDLYAPGLSVFASEQAKADWSKCLARVERDPEGAITSARAVLEAVCKQVLHARDMPHAASASLADLWKAAAKAVGLESREIAPDATRKILHGCSSIVAGIAELRNAHGDSHGKPPGAQKPGQRHSKLAVAAAGAVAAFLLSAHEARRPL
jgi:hypothetical protein